jgi:hypothetical protein
MLGTFGAVAPYLKTSASPRADTWVFKLHYKITVAILMASMLLNCLTNFIGTFWEIFSRFYVVFGCKSTVAQSFLPLLPNKYFLAFYS